MPKGLGPTLRASSSEKNEGELQMNCTDTQAPDFEQTIAGNVAEILEA
jgi:hypothetical protein